MDTVAVSAVAAAIVVGIVEGWRRVSRTAEGRVVRLGQNLGPRVQDIDVRLARVEGRLGIASPSSSSASSPAAPESETEGST